MFNKLDRTHCYYCYYHIEKKKCNANTDLDVIQKLNRNKKWKAKKRKKKKETKKKVNNNVIFVICYSCMELERYAKRDNRKYQKGKI